MAADRWWERFWITLRIRWVMAGVVVFLMINAVMYLGDLPNIGGGSNTPDAGEWTPVLLVIAFVIVLFAAMGRPGRSFGVGFVAALVGLTVMSLGSCTRRWADPVDYLVLHKRMSQVRATDRNQAATADMRWRDSVRAAGMRRGWGAKRLLFIRWCIEEYGRRDSSRSLPPDSATITNQGGGCRNWDTYFGERSGWHWRYTVNGDRSGFLLESYPDPAIGLAGPLSDLDETGLLVEKARAGAPSMALASPVTAMRELRECINKAIATPRSRGPASSLPLTLAAIRELPGWECKWFDNKLTEGFGAGDSNAVWVRIPREFHPRESVAAYTLLYDPKRGETHSFDVHARPRVFAYSGVRSFLLTQPGALHVAIEQRPATTADPSPEPCEVDPALPCARR